MLKIMNKGSYQSLQYPLCEITAMITFDKCSNFHPQCAQIRHPPVHIQTENIV